MAAPRGARRHGATGGQPSSSSAPTIALERALAVALGLVTVTIALLTYSAVHIEGAAGGADARAATEALIVQSRHIYADTQAQAFQSMASSYRRQMAEADAIDSVDPQQANLVRFTAQTYARQSGLSAYLVGVGADATFDYDRLFQTALHANDYRSIPSDQPGITLQQAAADHSRSRLLTLAIVGLLVVVVLLTCARLSRGRKARQGLAALAVAGYAALVTFGAVQVW